MNLLKQRRQNSFQLSREDLTPNPPSLQLEDVDVCSIAASFIAYKYNTEDTPDIPVYNRESNTIRRFSRIVSSPERSHDLSLSPEFAATSQSKGPEFRESTCQKNSRHVSIESDSEIKSALKTNSESAKPLENASPSSNLSARLASGISQWASRNPSFIPRDAELEENKQCDIKFQRSKLRHSTHSGDFPAFVPQFVPRRRSQYLRIKSEINNISTMPVYDDIPIIDEMKTDDSSETSSLSRVSRLESEYSSKTYASSITDVSSVNSPDFLGLCYNTNPENSGSLDKSVFIMSTIDKEIPPESPNDQPQSLVQSKTLANHATKAEPCFTSTISAKALSFDYCLDSGANYDESRFMIPLEYRLKAQSTKQYMGGIILREGESP